MLSAALCIFLWHWVRVADFNAKIILIKATKHSKVVESTLCFSSENISLSFVLQTQKAWKLEGLYRFVFATGFLLVLLQVQRNSLLERINKRMKTENERKRTKRMKGSFYAMPFSRFVWHIPLKRLRPLLLFFFFNQNCAHCIANAYIKIWFDTREQIPWRINNRSDFIQVTSICSLDFLSLPLNACHALFSDAIHFNSFNRTFIWIYSNLVAGFCVDVCVCVCVWVFVRQFC